MSLENSVWRQYHDERTLHACLVALYGCDAAAIASDESALYATLKRRLTKKELRCFIMAEAGMNDIRIMESLHVNPDELTQIKRKSYRKVRQDAMRNAVTGDTLDEEN